MRRLSLGLVVLLLLSGHARAQLSPDWTRCVNQDQRFSPDIRIGGCTAVINSGRERGKILAIAYNNRGSAYGRNGDYTRAIADYTRAIEIDPQFASAYNNRGLAYALKGDYDQAIADYTRAIEINPQLESAYDNRGLAYARKGDYDRAIADYTRAIEINPQFASAYNGRGAAYVGQGDYDRAIADCTRAIEIDPQLASAYKNRGHARYDKGDFKDAAVDFGRAIELENDAYAMMFRHFALTRSGASATAAELEVNASRLKDKSWPFPAIELLAGKRRPEAMLLAASKAEEVCEAHFYIGQWHLVLGEKTAAVRELKVAANTCPKTFVEYRAAVAELARLK